MASVPAVTGRLRVCGVADCRGKLLEIHPEYHHSNLLKRRSPMAVTKQNMLQEKISIKKKLVITLSMGGMFLVTPVILIVTDPMFLIAKYKFRLANGSILHEVLQSEMEGGRFAVYLFNITNADKFLSGEDYKLKLDEIGPFTYLEYRLHDNLEIDSSEKLMRYTPRMRSVFIPEESIAYPEHIEITMPNIPMLSATSMLKSSPYIIQSLYNMFVRQYNSKPIVKINAKEYLWGYKDPVLTLANTIVPGLIYFNSTGVMDRMYERSVDYRIELGTTDQDKFSIKQIKKFRRTSDQYSEAESFTEFNNTYEGMAYPPKITPDTPINIYRLGICRPFEMEVCGRKSSEYGANAFVYKFKDQMFDNKELCDSKGFCPKGIIDMSKCFYGLPMGLSNGHLSGVDKKVFDRLDGMKPDPLTHRSHMVIEPKIGLTLETSFSLQANIVTGDLSYNRDASPFSDMLIPIAHFKIKQPELPKIAIKALRLMYITVPFVLFIIKVVSGALGALGALYCGKLVYCSWLLNIEIINVPKESARVLCVEMPLIN